MSSNDDRSSHSSSTDEFVAEAQEMVEAFSRALLEADASLKQGDPPPPDTLNSAFRATHTLKGLASLFGEQGIAELAHDLEETLDDIRMGRTAFTVPVLDVLFEAVDVLSGAMGGEESDSKKVVSFRRHLSQLTDAAHADPGDLQGDLHELQLSPDLVQSLTEYEEHRLRANVSDGRRLYMVRSEFDVNTIDAELDALRNELKEVGEVITCLPSDEDAGEDRLKLDLLVATDGTGQEVSRIAGATGSQAEPVGWTDAPTPIPHPRPSKPAAATPAQATTPAPPATPAPEAAPQDAPTPVPAGRPRPDQGAEIAEAPGETLRSLSQTVRVNIEKLDSLMNTVGELALIRNEIELIQRTMEELEIHPDLTRDLGRHIRSLSRRLDEMQRGILEVRMVPLAQVFDKLARVVRKLSREFEKQVAFYVSGGETEIDKLIVEELSDPLMHIIRNCIDHGIEDPVTRTLIGKPAEGMVALRAFPRGNHVVIEVEDDGAGIDPEDILRHALQRGFVTPEVATELSSREILNLVFLPGFTTRSEAGSTSGRGVGMDVVKTNLAHLSGLIDVHSEVGEGTRFSLTLPITLAILGALLVRVGSETYAIPLSTVLEIFPIRKAELGSIEGREVVTLRGATLPLLRLEPIFGIEPLARRAPDDGSPEHVVVVGMAQHRVGLIVNELAGQQDIVIKSLGKSLSGLPGIAGATELSGRRTVLVLDIAALVNEFVSG